MDIFDQIHQEETGGRKPDIFDRIDSEVREPPPPQPPPQIPIQPIKFEPTEEDKIKADKAREAFDAGEVKVEEDLTYKETLGIDHTGNYGTFCNARTVSSPRRWYFH